MGGVTCLRAPHPERLGDGDYNVLTLPANTARAPFINARRRLQKGLKGPDAAPDAFFKERLAKNTP